MRTRSQTDKETSSRSRTRSQALEKSREKECPKKELEACVAASLVRRSKRTHGREVAHSRDGGGVQVKSSGDADDAKSSARIVKQDAIDSQHDDTKSPPRRHSVRKAVLDKQRKLTGVFRHQLFLEPTLARQARKRRERERFVEKHNTTSRHQTNEDVLDKVPTADESRTSQESEMDRRKGRSERIASRKRSSTLARLNEDIPSNISCAAKAPMRKMSAMVPVPEHSCLAATFRRSHEDPLPEGAVELMAQADMARRKIKKRRKGNDCHHSHSYSKASTDKIVRLDPSAVNGSRHGHQVTSLESLGLQQPHDGLVVSSPFPSSRSVAAYFARANNALTRRRLFAVDFLLSSNDISSMYAGIGVIYDLYQGEDFPPSVARLVLNTQAMGIILLTQSLIDHFAKPRVLGGLNISGLEARLVVKRVIDRLTVTLMEDMVLLPEQMLGVGLALPEILHILPILRKIVEGVRETFLILSDKVLSLGADDSVLVPITMAPQFVVKGMTRSNVIH